MGAQGAPYKTLVYVIIEPVTSGHAPHNGTLSADYATLIRPMRAALSRIHFEAAKPRGSVVKGKFVDSSRKQSIIA